MKLNIRYDEHGKIMVPEDFSQQRVRIINEYVNVYTEVYMRSVIVNSDLIRHIARRLNYNIDRNGTNDFLRRVIRKYIDFLRH